MSITYPEGGMPGLVLKQKPWAQRAIDTFKVQLVPLRAAPSAKIGGPEDVAKLMREMEDYDRESAKLIHLDTKNQVMGVETISVGSLSASIVHPRETVKGAILNNSANVIFVHNHPSGICEPSQEDLEISRILKEAFAFVGIELLDSMIVGKGCHYSLREIGFITGKTERSTIVSERISDLPKEERMRIAREIAATIPADPQQGKTLRWNELSKLPKDERLMIARGITATVDEVREPAITQETIDKIGFITATTEYIKAGSDLERRNRAGEKIKASRYFKPWFEEFFYEHDPQRAKQNLMKFFAANEQGLGIINYTHYGVIQEYLGAISKPALIIREKVKGAEVEIKYEPGKIFQYRVVHAGTDQTVQTREYPEAMAYYTEREAERGIAEEGLTLVKKGRTPTTVFQRLFPPITPQILKEYEDLYKIYGKKWAEDYRRDRGAGWEVLNLYSKSPTIADDYKAEFVEYARAGFEVYGEYKLENGMHNYYLYMKGGRTPTTVSENSQTTNNIEAFLNRLTVDTSRYSRAFPMPQSAVIGAAIPEDGFLFAYHVTDNPEEAIRKLNSNIPLCQMNPEGDLGCGFYVSGVPEYWRGRSTRKWEFAKNLTRAQRQSLVNVILSDPNYRKGGGYLADFEVDYLNRDLKQFVEIGDVNALAMTGNQPYNVHITKEIARKAGVPVPKEPGFIKVKMQGKFINAADMYMNQEIVNRAKAWAVINRPKLLEWNKHVSTQNVVNAWLCSMGYSGAFTRSGMSTNPEMVIWDGKAIIDAWIPEPQR